MTVPCLRREYYLEVVFCLFCVCMCVSSFPVSHIIRISSGSNFYFPFGDTFYPEFLVNDLVFAYMFYDP